MRRLTQNEVNKRLKERQFTLLSEYKNNRTKITVRCDLCDYEYNVAPTTFLNTSCGCPSCSGVSKITIDDFVRVLNKHNLELLDNPNVENFNSKLNMNVQCKKCHYKFTTNYNRVNSQNSSCAVCKNKKVLKGYNDIWTTNPELAKLLLNEDDGYKYTYSSNKKVLWKCSFCGNIMSKTVGDVYQHGLSCTNCSDGISYPEKFVKNLLHICNIDYTYQKHFNWSDNKKYDFYLHKYNLIIETHGIQHYEENSHFKNRTLLEEQENDRYKRNLAITNGIKNYIVLDCRYSKCDWIKNSIINSELFKICNINYEDINWEYIDLESRSSLVYKTCELYNKGFLKSDILKKLDISESTYCNYLNIGAKNNLCDYSGIKAIQERGRKSGIASRKPVLCITTNEKFDSIKMASEFYGFSSTHLSNCLINGNKYCGTYKNTNQRLEWKLL